MKPGVLKNNSAGALVSELSILLAVLTLALIAALSSLQSGLQSTFFTAAVAFQPPLTIAMSPDGGKGGSDPGASDPTLIQVAQNNEGGGSDTTMVPPVSTVDQGDGPPPPGAGAPDPADEAGAPGTTVVGGDFGEPESQDSVFY